MNNISVKFDKVRKSYTGDEFVVKTLNLEISDGEFLTMLGPSGSGKTTCLMMLAGFEDITSGEIYINNIPIRKTAPHKRNIGMVFQHYALFPHMTIEQNLAYPLRYRNYSKAASTAQVKKYLELVELGGFAKRYPAQLSGGQKQRVAVARALVYEPEIVLMDEPLGALDKNLREQMQLEIKKIHEMLKVTIIYVTHDQSEALTMSDRIAVFNEGIIQQLSTPKELYEKPENRFVSEFIGENNSLDVEIVSLTSTKVEGRFGGNKDTVSGVPVGLTKSDTRAYLMVRPENILINPKERNVKCDYTFKAEITQLIYIGDHLRVSVCLAGKQPVELVSKQPNTSMLSSLQRGDKVTVGWQSQSCRFFAH